MVISGCSGGGKSSLIAELQRRGHAVVEEAGRRIVREETAAGGRALPWVDMAAFARRAIALALEDRESAAELPGTVFFDRSVVDVAAALDHASGESVLDVLGAATSLCGHRVHGPHPGRNCSAAMESGSTISRRRGQNMTVCAMPMQSWAIVC